jgi:hypothetical protein
VPLLDSLSAIARQAFPIIQRGVREGLSANALGRVLAEGGLGIRRQTLLDIVRAEKGVQVAGAALRFLRETAIPNPLRLPEALTTIRRLYSFMVEVRGIAGDTGERISQFITVTSNTLLTKREIQELALEAVERGGERYDFEPDESLLVGGLRAGPAGTLS